MQPQLKFLMITTVPDVALEAERAGVDRLFIDWEIHGKQARQAGMGTPIYGHTEGDAKAVRAVLKTSELLIRVNPVHDKTEEEVQRALDCGADWIMLPYFKSPAEVEKFLMAVNGRAKTSLLFESGEAVGRAEQILSLGGYDEVHFGLNDLRIALKLDFLFESFAGGLIDWLSSLATKNGKPFGIGGVGKVGKELLPAEMVIKEHVRLGSRAVILSRVFHQEAKSLAELREKVDLVAEVQKIRAVEAQAHLRSSAEVERDRQEFVKAVQNAARQFNQGVFIRK